MLLRETMERHSSSRIATALSALLVLTWCLVFLFAITRLGFALRETTIIAASLLAIVAEQLLAAARENPQMRIKSVFDRTLLRITLWRMSGILVILAAFEVALRGDKFVK